MARSGVADRGSEARRRYAQYCAVARGLDVIGDRWTLLIVRDLLLGPKRYKDLVAGLPGIGTNLLAARLRELEAAGLVQRRTLPPPAASSVYELTDAGEALQPVLRAIGQWGGRFAFGPPRTGDVVLPSPFFVAMRSSFRAEIAGDLRESYEFRIGERVFHVLVEDGTCRTSEGPSSSPSDVVFTMDVQTLSDLMLGLLSADDALRDGRVTVAGDREALSRFLEIFRLPAHLTRDW